MKLFTDVKIGHRLGVGFGITLAMMVIIVVTAVWYVTSIGNNLDRMAATETVKSEQASGTGQTVEEAKKTVSTARMVFIILGVVNLLLGIIFSGAITRSITLPILRSSGQIDQMAKGDFSLPVSEHAIRRKDEMGIFARSMDTMNRNLGQMLKQVLSSAAEVASASTQLSASAETLSRGATNQVEKSSLVATASTEMNQTSEDIARTSSSITQSAAQTVQVAKGGTNVVHSAIREVNFIAETVESASGYVKALGQESEKIGNIVTAINEIAEQTNLLALNAAIEAARAGEHGRGFAVVADEVKKLAERTSMSTTEIGDMIRTVREGVKKTVEAMEKAKEKVITGVQFSSEAQTALQNIIGSIEDLYGSIDQVGAAIEEMSATTNEISRDIIEISVVTRQTLSSSQDIAGSATAMSQLAGNLQGIVQAFKV